MDLEKVVSSACYDKQQVCIFTRPFSWSPGLDSVPGRNTRTDRRTDNIASTTCCRASSSL